MIPARRLWALAEPYHALVYFSSECVAAGDAAGLRGFWQTYFAFRAAPLGAVAAETVTAIFYNFAPAFVARRVPAVWEAVSPAAALEARLGGVDAALRRVFGEQWVRSGAAREAALLAGRAAAAVEPAGRPLGFANAALPVPEEPHLALWQAITTLREHRGDGHNAALLEREVDGCAAHVLAAAAERTSREWLMKARGWDDAAWTAAAQRLAERDWLDGDRLTPEGRAMVDLIEADTDRLASRPWRELGEEGCMRLAELLVPLRFAVADAGDWPAANPIGVPEPD